MERILVVRLGHLGDIIHSLPAVAALREAYPAARIGWAVEERWSDLLFAPGAQTAPPGTPERPLVDEVHFVNTETWRKAPFSLRTWREIRAAGRGLRQARYEAVVDLQGLWKSIQVVLFCGAPIRVGFARPRDPTVRGIYTLRVPARRSHILEQNLELVEGLTGLPAGPPRFLLPRDTAAEAWCEEELLRRGLKTFAILSPGAGWGAKLWPAERYAAVARDLVREKRLACLVNIGPKQQKLGRAVVTASAGAAQTIECSVGRLVALTRRATLAIGGDTGPIHLAAALGIPVVAVFGPTSPARNGPYGTRSIVLRSPKSRTSYSHVPWADAGLRSIAAPEVTAAALRLLEESASGRRVGEALAAKPS